MNKRTSLFIFGAALFASAALVVCAAPRTTAAQSSSAGSSTSSSAAKKKKKTSAKSRRRGRGRSQTAPAPDRIKEIQAALQKDGSYDGEPTGKWDAKTVDAMKKFQDKNGFSPTGKIDALSLNKLGLGSETAGKGAPMPATTASSSPTPVSAPTSPASPPAAPPAQ
jgi:peptidoglycan hydrolase-like protein with peptidoglycan-binding domain